MTEVFFLGVTLDICNTSGGIWFDQGEFGRIRNAATRHMEELDHLVKPGDGEKKPLPQQLLCPSCATPLEGYSYLGSSPIMLDTCSGCGGIFVEDGELKKICEFLESRNRPGRRSPMLTPEGEEAYDKLAAETTMNEHRARAVVGVMNELRQFVRYF